MLLLSNRPTAAANSHGLISRPLKTSKEYFPCSALPKLGGEKIQRVTCPSSQVHARIYSSPLLYHLLDLSAEVFVYIHPERIAIAINTTPAAEAFRSKAHRIRPVRGYHRRRRSRIHGQGPQPRLRGVRPLRRVEPRRRGRQRQDRTPRQARERLKTMRLHTVVSMIS